MSNKILTKLKISIAALLIAFCAQLSAAHAATCPASASDMEEARTAWNDLVAELQQTYPSMTSSQLDEWRHAGTEIITKCLVDSSGNPMSAFAISNNLKLKVTGHGKTDSEAESEMGKWLDGFGEAQGSSSSGGNSSTGGLNGLGGDNGNGGDSGGGNNQNQGQFTEQSGFKSGGASGDGKGGATGAQIVVSQVKDDVIESQSYARFTNKAPESAFAKVSNTGSKTNSFNEPKEERS